MSSVVCSVSIGCGILLMSSWSTLGIVAACVNCGASTKFNGRHYLGKRKEFETDSQKNH